MRVALFTETFLPKVDGIVTTLTKLLAHLPKRGHESLLFAPMGGPRRYAGTDIVGLPSFSFPIYPELRIAPPLFPIRLQTFNPDVVHVLNPISLGLIGMAEARRLDLPLVASYHTDLPRFASRWGWSWLQTPLWTIMRSIHNQADLNLAPSQLTAQGLRSHRFKHVDIWGRGVDKNLFSPKRRCRTWRDRLTAGHPNAKLLLYVDRLATEKRIDWLAPALKSFPDARMAIVGDGPQREDLQHLFAGLPATFTGYLHGEDLACAYACADVFLFPGANETFGNVVLEAMASGLPVVTADRGAVWELVIPGENGLLFNANDSQDLKRQVHVLLDDSALARKMGAKGRAIAETKSLESVFDGLLEKYSSLAQARSKAVDRPMECAPRRRMMREAQVSVTRSVETARPVPPHQHPLVLLPGAYAVPLPSKSRRRSWCRDPMDRPDSCWRTRAPAAECLDPGWIGCD